MDSESMLARARIVLARPLGARGFATRSIYVGRVPSQADDAAVHEKFGKYGTIAAVRHGPAHGKHKYLHVQYVAGEHPYMDKGKTVLDWNPTRLELEEVIGAVDRAIAECNETELCGEMVAVKHARAPREPGAQEAHLSAAAAAATAAAAPGRTYEDGYARGYREGLVDGQKMGRSA
ncbi:hypothetical protein H4R18_003962 [Coemansia javaensis]|uniref:RRM domain-containing protein n=1 Tax=Coemansia javaensis TaxID=2761396 RepID=A0A9W8HD14_9FUNG|nr:hypothetical protein H4R18_003962 [Coemansia javaensis]